MIRGKTTIIVQGEKPSFGLCYDCGRAYLMRSEPHNPVVSRCTIDGRREVARSTVCPLGRFKQCTGEPVIHPMIYVHEEKPL